MVNNEQVLKDEVSSLRNSFSESFVFVVEVDDTLSAHSFVEHLYRVLFMSKLSEVIV